VIACDIINYINKNFWQRGDSVGERADISEQIKVNAEKLNIINGMKKLLL